MNHILNGLFGPGRKPKPLSFLTTLYCPNCKRLFAASRIGSKCTWCASENTYPADQWPEKELAGIREAQEQRRKSAMSEA